MATNIVINTNISTTTDDSNSEMQFLNELMDMNADQLCDHISSLILSCESKKDDLLNVKRQQNAYYKDCIKHNNNYKQNKLFWTGVKCVALACGGIAVFLPGFGWFVGGIIFAANGGTMYGDYRCDKQYKQEVSEFITRMEANANDAMSVAKTVSNRKDQFDRERMRLVDQGVDSDHAAILLIMAMLTGQFRPVQQINITLPEQHNPINNTSMPLLISKGAQEKIAEWSAKVANKMGLGLNISQNFVRKFCAAIAVAGIAYDIYKYAKVCLETSKAMDRAEELINVIDKGITSTEYFINLLKHVRDNISRHNIRQQLSNISLQLDYQHKNFDDRLNQMDQLIRDCGLDVRHEFQSFRQQQSIDMERLVFVLNNMNRSINDRNHQLNDSDNYEIVNSIDYDIDL